jgi:hypothetical protein
VILAWAAVAALLAAAPPSLPGGSPSLRAQRVNDPPRVDGLLDDAVWSQAEAAGGFRQREPHEGSSATQSTEVRVLYDKEQLYVGVLARDREPEGVLARLLQRDSLMQASDNGGTRFPADDVVVLLFDPFHDRKSGFVFATNPNGAMSDALVTDENATFNTDWQGIWRVAAQRTPEGWSAEFAIPFRTLRYPSRPPDPAWGLNVMRTVRRTNEESLWCAWSRGEGGLHRVSQAGRLLGLTDLPRSSLNLEVRPYGLSGVTQEREATGRVPTDTQWDLGLDAKWEVKPGIVLDVTAKPDFAQVEADDQAVNLTRFDLFFPEKREFFLENAGVFEFGTRGFFEPPPFLLFFSRRIGIADDGPVPVLGGARLSGRAGKQTIGFLSILTDEAFGEPRTNFGVLRIKRDLPGNGYLGGMVTDRRTSAGAHTDFGADASYWLSRRLNVSGFFARTTTSGPGGDDVAWRAAADYVSDRLTWGAEHMVIGPQAEAESGFVTRTDIRRTAANFDYSFRPAVLGLRRFGIFGGALFVARTTGEAQERNGYLGYSFDWSSGDRFGAFYTHGFTQVDEAFDVADRLPVPAGRFDLRDLEVFGRTSTNRAISLAGSGRFTRNYGGHLDHLEGAIQLTSGRHLTLAAAYGRSRAELPSGAFTAHLPSLRCGWAFSTRLVAATFAQYNSLEKQLLVNFRLNFTYRPGSDLYVVFNEERGEEAAPRVLINRGLAVKLSYLARF